MVDTTQQIAQGSEGLARAGVPLPVLRLRHCGRCGLPETYETLELDGAGVCNICKQREFRDESINWAARKADLGELVEAYRGKHPYDCIVPFSGGKDSTYTLNYLVREFGLKPLVVQFDHGFMRPQLLAVRYEKTTKPHIAWKYSRGVSNQPSPILVGDEVYFVGDSGGLVTCLDAHSGEVHWRERIGGNYSASPLHANGKLYFQSREGETTVLKPGKTFKVLAKNKLDGQHMASAAVDGDALILRTDKALYRIEK